MDERTLVRRLTDTTSIVEALIARGVAKCSGILNVGFDRPGIYLPNVLSVASSPKRNADIGVVPNIDDKQKQPRFKDHEIYPSIVRIDPIHFEEWEKIQPKEENVSDYVITEKVHGANMTIYIDHNRIDCCSKNQSNTDLMYNMNAMKNSHEFKRVTKCLQHYCINEDIKICV